MSQYDGNTPTLGQAITRGAKRVLEAADWALPCRVIKIREDFAGSVDLAPLVQALNDAGEPEAIPTIPCVPVAVWKIGDFVLTAPIALNTTGVALVASRAITQWLASGNADAEPEGKRKGNRADAIFLPHLQPFTDRPSAEPSDRLVLALDSSRTGITIDSSGVVYAGNEATVIQAVALSPPVTADFNALLAELQAISVAIAGVGGAYTPTWPGPTNNAANRLKAE